MHGFLEYLLDRGTYYDVLDKLLNKEFQESNELIDSELHNYVSMLQESLKSNLVTEEILKYELEREVRNLLLDLEEDDDYDPWDDDYEISVEIKLN